MTMSIARMDMGVPISDIIIKKWESGYVIDLMIMEENMTAKEFLSLSVEAKEIMRFVASWNQAQNCSRMD